LAGKGKRDAYDTDHETVSPYDDAPNINGGVSPYATRLKKSAVVDPSDPGLDYAKMKAAFMK